MGICDSGTELRAEVTVPSSVVAAMSGVASGAAPEVPVSGDAAATSWRI